MITGDTMTPAYDVTAFSAETAQSTDLDAVAALEAAFQAEEWTETFVPSQHSVRRTLTERFSTHTRWWIVRRRSDRRPAGVARVFFPGGSSVPGAFVYVRQEERRCGLGQLLADHVLQHARQLGCSRVAASTVSTISSGEAFARKWGATLLRQRMQQILETDRCDRTVLDYLAGATDLTVTTRCGGYDEQHLWAIARLKQRLAGTYGLPLLPLWQAARVARHTSLRVAARGVEQWTTYAFAGAELLGLAEGYLDPAEPDRISDLMVAVVMGDRSGALAATTARLTLDVLAARPAVRVFWGETLSSDSRLISFNEALGYRVHHERREWLVDVPERGDA